MPTTVVEVERASGRARVRMSAGAGTVLVPRLIDRTDDWVEVALVAGGAMLLAGDRLDVRIVVGPGCSLTITEVGGTVAYGGPDPARPGPASAWDVEIELGAAACLGWKGREVIVADGADLHRRTRLAAEAGAVAVLRETTVLGRTGELGGRVRQATSMTVGDEPVLVEETVFSGHHPVPGVLGAERVLDSVTMVGRRPVDPTGAMELEAPGALARFLGTQLHRSPLDTLYDRWRDELAERTS